MTAGVTHCGRCGAPAIQRRAGRGPNLGGFFWGCSRYPKCRWTKDIGIGPTPDPDASRPTNAVPRRPDALILGGAVIGIPGGSAQQQFERRTARDQAKRNAHLAETVFSAVVAAIAVGTFIQIFLKSNGVLVGLLFGVLFLLGRLAPRMTTEAWSIGASGEVATARHLDKLADDGYVVMHDLRISMSTANIDHLVIGPTGVFVVETKNIKGKVRINRGEVFIGGRRVRVADEVRREVDAVANALGPLLESLGIEVQPVICAHRADLPWFHRSVSDIPIVYPRQLPSFIRDRDAVLSQTDVAELRARAAGLVRRS